VVLRRQLKRRDVLAFFQKVSPCLVGIEACASSHHGAVFPQNAGHNPTATIGALAYWSAKAITEQ
jgi:transposase